MPQGYKLATQKAKDSQQQANYWMTLFVLSIYTLLFLLLLSG